MSAPWDRVRAALARTPGPVRLRWAERSRRRFLGEYHEMKARSGADLFDTTLGLVWYGALPSSWGPVEYAIRYHRLHPAVPPAVYVLSPSSVRGALPSRGDGRLDLLGPRDWHAGLTAFDVWQWLAAMVIGLSESEEERTWGRA